MNVLLIAGPDDVQARRVGAELSARGARPVRLDAVRFPDGPRISLSIESVRLGRRPLPEFRSAYLRALACHPLTPGFEDDLRERPRGLIAQCDEKRALLESLILGLEARGVRLVNGLEANDQHSRKPFQLERLGRAGLPVPAWLATNDPAAVRRFAREFPDVVYKPLAGGATVRKVTPEDLSSERLEALRVAPVLFQEYVPGVPVRVYVVGGRAVAAAEIRSPEIDYRRAEESVEPTRLSPDERRACVTAARACGMAFAGVDLIRSDGRFVVLECNPSPMFAAFEKKTGQDVAGPLARLLTQ